MKLIKDRVNGYWPTTSSVQVSLFLARNSNVKHRKEHSFHYILYFACSKGLSLPLNPISCNKRRGITASYLVSCLLPCDTAVKLAGLVVLCSAPESSWLRTLQQATYCSLMSMKRKVNTCDCLYVSFLRDFSLAGFDRVCI